MYTFQSLCTFLFKSRRHITCSALSSTKADDKSYVTAADKLMYDSTGSQVYH